MLSAFIRVRPCHPRYLGQPTTVNPSHSVNPNSASLLTLSSTLLTLTETWHIRVHVQSYYLLGRASLGQGPDFSEHPKFIVANSLQLYDQVTIATLLS